MSDNETLIALLAIRTKIDSCRHQGLHLTVNTLRHQAMCLAESFVDPVYAAEQDARPQPVMRDGVAMSQDIDPRCGF